MIGIIGRKLGMTQIFNEQGQQIPVTVVEAEPNPVTKVVAKETAGFASVELGMGAQRLARVSKQGERIRPKSHMRRRPACRRRPSFCGRSVSMTLRARIRKSRRTRLGTR